MKIGEVTNKDIRQTKTAQEGHMRLSERLKFDSWFPDLYDLLPRTFVTEILTTPPQYVEYHEQILQEYRTNKSELWLS